MPRSLLYSEGPLAQRPATPRVGEVFRAVDTSDTYIGSEAQSWEAFGSGGGAAYDDTALQAAVDAVEADVATLQAAVAAGNSQVSVLAGVSPDDDDGSVGDFFLTQAGVLIGPKQSINASLGGNTATGTDYQRNAHRSCAIDFTPSSDIEVDGLRFRIKRPAGDYAGLNIRYGITDAGKTPIVEISEPINNIPVGPGTGGVDLIYNVFFTTPITLTSGTTYYIFFESDAGASDAAAVVPSANYPGTFTGGTSTIDTSGGNSADAFSGTASDWRLYFEFLDLSGSTWAGADEVDFDDSAAITALDTRVGTAEVDIIGLDVRVDDLEALAGGSEAIPYVVAGVGAPNDLVNLADVQANGSNDAVVLQDALTLARTSGRPLWLAGGTFDLDADVQLSPGSRGSVADGLHIHAIAPTRIEVASQRYKPFFIAGWTSQDECDVTANVAARATSITVASIGALQVGDWIVLRSDENFDPDRLSQCKKGEWAKVKALPNSTTITLETPTVDSYDAATAVVDLHVLARNVRLTGPVTVVGEGPANTTQASSRLVWIEGSENLYIDEWTAQSGTDSGFCIANGVRPRVGKVYAWDTRSPDAGTGYGLKFEGCLDAVAEAVVGGRNRHTVDTNGGGDIGSRRRPVNRNTEFGWVIAENDYSAAFGNHPGSVLTRVKNMKATNCGGHAMLRGEDCRIDRVITRGYSDAGEAYHPYVIGDDGTDATGYGLAGLRPEIGRIDRGDNVGAINSTKPRDALVVNCRLTDAVLPRIGKIPTEGTTGVLRVDDKGKGPTTTLMMDKPQGRTNGANVGQFLNVSNPAAAFVVASKEITIDTATSAPGDAVFATLTVPVTGLGNEKRWTLSAELTTISGASQRSRFGLVLGATPTDALVAEIDVQTTGATTMKLISRGTVAGTTADQTTSIGTIASGGTRVNIELQRLGDSFRIIVGRAGRLTDIGALWTPDAAQLAAINARGSVGIWANGYNSTGVLKWGSIGLHKFA